MTKSLLTLLLMLGLASAGACGKAGADADDVRARGRAHLNRGEYDLAIAVLDSAIAMDPDDALLYRDRGMSYRARDDYDRAIRDFDRAVELDPRFASAINSRGFTYQLKGDYDRAIEDYDKSIELAPESPAAYRNRANARFILGRFADAASDLARSVKFVEAATPPPARFDETGGYAVVWLHVARMRAGQDDAAEFAANAARVDSTQWPRPVISFFQGTTAADQLVAGTASVADEKLRDDQRCGAEFFAGQAAIWRKLPSEARKRLETMTKTCSKRFIEYAVAEADLARLGAAAR